MTSSAAAADVAGDGHRLVSPEPPRWARDPDVVALVLTGQVVAPVGVLSLAWLAS